MGDTTIEWTTKFWRNVDRGAPDACWPWMAGRFADGMRYGQIRVGAKKMKAHRVAFILAGGMVDAEKALVLHTCKRWVEFPLEVTS